MTDLLPSLALACETTAFTLATLDPDGSPRATLLYFANHDRLTLYLLSDPTSPHCQNLVRESRTGAALFPPVEDWRQIRGLQMEGHAEKVPEAERQKVMSLYPERFPVGAGLWQVVRTSEFFRFAPTWVRLIDNRLSFGHKQEWQFP